MLTLAALAWSPL